MQDEELGEQVAWASRPCSWAEKMYGRDADANSLPVFTLKYNLD